MAEKPEPTTDGDQLQERVRELELANRELSRINEQMAQFVNILANDLRSPLRHIMGFCRIVKHEFARSLGPRGATFMDNAVVSARRIRELVDDLVTISRVQREEFDPKTVRLDDIVSEVRTALDASIRESEAKILHGRLPKVKGSPELLRILIENLIDNAIKYRGEKKPSIHLFGEPCPDGWEITVTDNGLGISPERHDIIFDAFNRTEEKTSAYGTTGLGLFICKEIVERHKGTIRVESKVGEGSKFIFTISDSL